MNDIALSSLRVAAEIDASKYKTGADQKIVSDREMTASAQAVGAAISQTDTKISSAGDTLAKLSRQYIDGFKNQERFEQGLRQIGRQLDSGKTDIEGATRLLVGMNQKLGLTADVSELAAKGQVHLAAAVGKANAQIEGQAASMAQAAATAAAQAERLETIRQKYDQTYAAGQRMNSELADLAELERSGTQITGGYATALENLVLKYDQTAAAAATAANAHKQFLAAARSDQAAENSRQIAAANQGSFNSVLGVSAPSSGARASASVFEADFAQMEEVARQKAQQAGQAFGADLEASLVAGTAKSARDAAAVFSADFAQIEEIAGLKAQQAGQAFGTELDASLVAGIAKSARDAASVFTAEMDRLDTIAKLKAEQIGSTFQSDLNASFGIGSGGNSARASASVFEEAGREADQMASRVAALRAELNPLAAVQDRVNAELAEYSALAAKGAISADELAQAQAMARGRLAANQNSQGGANKFAGMNATSQFQDIAITSMMGQSIPTIALQQGTQLGMALQMSLGEQGAAGGAKALLAGLTGLFSPINLVAIGLTAVVAAGIQFGSKLLPQTKSLKDATDAQRKSVDDLASAYGNASLKADDFYKKSVIASESDARRKTDDLQKAAAAADKSVQNELGSPFTIGRGRETFYGVKPEFAQFGEAISILNGQIKAGRPDYAAFEKSISGVVAQNPGLQTTADKILAIVAAATAAAAQLHNTGEAIKDINRGSIGNFDRTQQAGRDQSVMSQRFGDDPFAAQREQQRQKEIALTEAQDQRKRSLDNTLASAKLDVDLIGKTTAATEGLRMAFQLEQEVREAAAQSNTKVDEAEIARIKQKAEEYGKLKALQEARDTIHGQEIDLETQRAEVATVGENTLARQRSAAALKTEQDIRKLGIPLYGQEANAMRANTAALSDQAAALAKASLQADLLFERSQILRNSDDQAIASRLQSAGLPIDLNSAEANMMRYNMALQETKDTFKGFATDMLSSLQQGKSLWESFGDAAKNALAKIADKLIDRGLDGIFNSLFGGDQANGGGGLLGSLFGGNGSSSSQNGQQQGTSGGSFLSKLFGTGGQSVASMQVQAAVVNVNGGVGGVGGGLSDILSKLGSPSFKADTTLSDILGFGGGAANDNQSMIQSRIDQAFGTGGSAQSLIQSRIDQAFGTTSGGLGGIFSPSGGFASVLGGGSGGLSGSMSSYASAIKMIESAGSGGYSALGPVLRNGDQALGAYQVMNSNLPSWSTQAFGSPMSKSQFMSDPAAQDAIFQQQFGKLLSKYGNSNDAASAWFTGGPLSKGAGKSDVLGTTGSQYVDKFNTALQKVTGTAQQATGSISSLGGASEGLIAQFSKMGQSLMSQLTSATSSSSWFQGLSGMFGGSSGALGFMNSISPAATSDILSGSWGLFDDGGFTGAGGRKDPAGIVHRGEVVWSQDDVARAGGVHVVEGMRRGYAGYADGGVVRPRMRYEGRHSDSPSGATSGRSRDNNERPMNVNQTFVLSGQPEAPRSQSQIAARALDGVSRAQRTA
ncbi:hypothetical protein C8D77_101199 [Mesorhizobium loti]|uniref:Bacteriophage tail tape measure N-terminal domain-containing protein n=1 Tax=Rhizobium loti TaxID=381 RepID=A0A8E2WIB7_RHILI|nr:hypothetical protein [Mesorhizobium loti]PWJ93520.1 hypothetical protein C8D77_101199 [Mesorhizobium loti]